jgi:predicted DCC family thiol-disulfide oxidoreductase YuxK
VTHPLILYDGVCGLCDRAVQFVLKRDHQDRFRFAALQGDTAQRLIAHNKDVGQSDTIYLALNSGQPDQILLTQSDAVIAILDQLDGWHVLASLLRIIPHPLRNWGYRFVARHRYQIFGRYDACPIPSPSDRHKFLE